MNYRYYTILFYKRKFPKIFNFVRNSFGFRVKFCQAMYTVTVDQFCLENLAIFQKM